jgi:hypothetical protein
MINIVPLKRKLINFYINSRGYRTDRKIVVIESDDWGSIRMPSKQVYDDLLSRGFPVDKLSYLKYDALESNRDLEALFDVLTSLADKNGNHPVFTANTIMTNPDFDKIRENGFINYYYELFTETLKRYPEHDRVFDLYKNGIKRKVFYPQLHGLEHLNIRRWMSSLQNENGKSRVLFDYGLFDLSTSDTIITEDSFCDPLSLDNRNELHIQDQRLLKAAYLFNSIFGYPSRTFIAPCYIWRPELQKTFYKMGINNIQSGSYQLIPKIGKYNKWRKKIHYTGKCNKYQQTYSVRNCYFEPSSNENKNVIESCLNQVSRSFNNRKPAIICSHRLNYIGFIQEFNRTKNLELLHSLLDNIMRKWPDVEFLSSEDLALILKFSE